MITPACPFNDSIIRNAIWSSGLTVNEVAFRVHMPAKTLQHIVDGKTDPIDVRLDTLKRLADHLALPLRALFAEPAPPVSPQVDPTDTQADAGLDATTVVAVLYDRGTTPTVNHDLARALGWTLARLQAAYDDAEDRLAPAGLRLLRTHGEVSVIPCADHTDARRALAHSQSNSTGTRIVVDAYKAIHQVLTGAPVLPGTTGIRRRMILGDAGRLGVLDLQARTPTLTEAALAAFPKPWPGPRRSPSESARRSL